MKATEFEQIQIIITQFGDFIIYLNMFGKIKKTKLDNPHITGNSIMEGTVVVGDINTDGNIRIDGTVKGIIKADGKVVIGQNGVIEGEVICKNADISGTLKTKITVYGLLTLKSTANILGDIKTDMLEIEAGANFSGNCDMNITTEIENNKKK